MNPQILGRMGSGEAVIDRYSSHAHSLPSGILEEALGRIQSSGRCFLVEEVDFGRPIGEAICVRTGPSDEIVFAKRPRRFGFTRFVKNRLPEVTSSVVVIVKKADDYDGFVLITAFSGAKAEPEPWDRNATVKSREFWSSHAIVWGSEETVSGTETSQCPW